MLPLALPKEHPSSWEQIISPKKPGKLAMPHVKLIFSLPLSSEQCSCCFTTPTPIFGKPYAESSGPGDLDTQQHWVRAGGRDGSCLTYAMVAYVQWAWIPCI